MVVVALVPIIGLTLAFTTATGLLPSTLLLLLPLLLLSLRTLLLRLLLLLGEVRVALLLLDSRDLVRCLVTSIEVLRPLRVNHLVANVLGDKVVRISGGDSLDYTASVTRGFNDHEHGLESCG